MKPACARKVIPSAAALRRSADFVVRLQRPDGTWLGRSPYMKEDELLVATPLAVSALASAAGAR